MARLFKTEGDIARAINYGIKCYIDDHPRYSRFDIQLIESHGTGHAIPDAFYTTKNEQGWIEFKIGKVVDGRLKVEWRPGQLSWIDRYIKRCKAANAFLVIAVDDTLVFIHNEKIEEQYHWYTWGRHDPAWFK